MNAKVNLGNPYISLTTTQNDMAHPAPPNVLKYFKMSALKKSTRNIGKSFNRGLHYAVTFTTII